MVLVINCNPAIDRICKLTELKPGKVNRLTYARNIAGGKGVNVARVLAKYGIQVAISGFIAGHNGRFIAEEVEKWGIDNQFVITKGNTRCNTNIIAADGSVTEVLEAGEEITPDEIDCFLKKYAEHIGQYRVVVLSGSLTKGLPVDFYKTLIKTAKDAGCLTILDTAGEALKAGIEAKPDFIKPNQTELMQLCGEDEMSEQQIQAACDKLHSQGIANIVVSLGESGLRMRSLDAYYIARPPKLRVNNTVACGDCAVATLAMGVIKGWKAEEMIKEATAISAANATTEENCDLPSDVIDWIRAQIKVEKI